MPSRYGTGELYGLDFSTLPPERVRELSAAPYRSLVCPFRPLQPGKPHPMCNKRGGVCSLRQFLQDRNGGVEGTGEPVTTCPNRFFEGNLIAQWVGETLLGTTKPVVISELPFLMGDIQAGGSRRRRCGEDQRGARQRARRDPSVVRVRDPGRVFLRRQYGERFQADADVDGAGRTVSAGSATAGLPLIRAQAADAAVANQGADNQPVGKEDGGRD